MPQCDISRILVINKYKRTSFTVANLPCVPGTNAIAVEPFPATGLGPTIWPASGFVDCR